MGLSDQRKAREGVYVDQNGIEYVNMAEAARRVGRNASIITRLVQRGELFAEDFSSRGLPKKIKWIELNKLLHYFALIDAKKKTKKTESVDTSHDFVMKDLSNGELPAIKEEEMPTLADVDDPENSDCWKCVNGIPIVTDDGHHVILYDKFKQKYDALIRKQQYEREKGKLISRELVDRAFSTVYTPMVNTINQIPDRFASRVVGFVESIMETKLDNSQTTSLRALLEDEAKAIISTLDQNQREAMDSFEV